MSVSFLKTYSRKVRTKSRPWDDQELADFYRATDMLRQAGLNTECDFGVTDEDDPWFVFVRPETGDVIAHFARIDGQFIAVSSLNEEVYRGNNIREIVDRMLVRHPTLIPQNKSDKKIFLHPTAALTAFLAAAFILSVDGIKAKNLKEVLVEAASLQKEKNSQAEAQTQVATKVDLFKVASSDLSAVNYNAAVHGMALIASELGFEDTSQALADHNNAELLNVAPRVNETGGHTPLVFGLNQSAEVSVSRKTVQNSQDNELFAQKNELTFVSIDKMELESLGNNATLVEADFQIQHEILIELLAMETRAGEFWGDDYLVSRDTHSRSYSDKILKAGEAIHFSERVEAEPIDDGNPTALSERSDEAQFVGEQINEYSYFENASFPKQLASIGKDFLLVSVEQVGLRDDLVFLESRPVDITASNFARFDSVSLGPDALAPDLRPVEEANEAAAQGRSQFSIATPILGHSFKDPGHVLQMTEAIDVVFYNGGNAEIAGFELGKDLLWSFLSQDQLEQAEKSINNAGDLILDFGDNGTLALIGVVHELTHDLVI